ncbi:hypothetical protein [Gordonia sp. NPDC003422]
MPTTRFLGRYDTRSGATLISTGGVLPMPLIGLAWPAVLRPGGLLPLLIVWAFITVIFSYTAWRGYLSDRAFGIVGGCGIVGICATAMVLSGEMARQAVLGLVAVIPTIAAIAVSAFLIWGLLGLAIGGSTSVILATASSGPDALVCVGAMLGTIVVPVFLVVALRRSRTGASPSNHCSSLCIRCCCPAQLLPWSRMSRSPDPTPKTPAPRSPAAF